MLPAISLWVGGIWLGGQNHPRGRPGLRYYRVVLGCRTHCLPKTHDVYLWGGYLPLALHTRELSGQRCSLRVMLTCTHRVTKAVAFRGQKKKGV